MMRQWGWICGMAAWLAACVTAPHTVRAPAPDPWTLDTLVMVALAQEGALEFWGDPAFASPSAPPSPWQAGFTLPTNPDRILRPLSHLVSIRAKNALIAQRLETLWAARTRVRHALIDYCEARELARFQPLGEITTAVRLAKLGGAAFVPLAELQTGVVLCTDFMSLPAPAAETVLLRAAFAHRTDYLMAIETYLYEKSLWHKRRGAPPRPTGGTVPIATSAADGARAPATVEVAVRHRQLVSEVREYGYDYLHAYHAAATAGTRGLDLARIQTWYGAQRALTPLEDATRSVFAGQAGLARPW